ncbi:MAG: DUF4130 domain-containing protein [Candidatus Altiarchaeota archaeon]
MRRMFNLACRHRDFDRQLYEKVLGQDRALVENCATPEARRLYLMQRSVSRCFHLKRSFMRLNLSPKGILYAKTRLEHNVIDMILEHFQNRFPTFQIAIEWEDMGKTYVIDSSGGIRSYNTGVESVVEAIGENMEENPVLEGLCFDGQVWGDYYNSQYIPERRNTRLMKKMMPLKYRDKHILENRNNPEFHRITDYSKRPQP